MEAAHRPRELRGDPVAQRDRDPAAGTVEEVVSSPRPAMHGSQQPGRSSVGACSRQVGRNAAVELSERAHLLLAQARQAALSSLLHQLHVPGPFLSLFPGHRGRLQACSPAPGGVAGRLVVVEPHEVFVRSPGPVLRIGLDEGGQRIPDRPGHAPPHVRRQSFPPRHVPGQQFELFDRQQGAADPSRRKGICTQQIAPPGVANHDRPGHQVPQPLCPPVDHDADRTGHPGRHRLQVHDPDQVPQRRPVEGKGLATRVHHPQTQGPLARSAPAPERLEEEEVAPEQEKTEEDEYRSRETPNGFVEDPEAARHKAYNQNRQQHYCKIDGQGSRARTYVGEHVVEAHMLGSFHPEPAVQRGRSFVFHGNAGGGT